MVAPIPTIIMDILLALSFTVAFLVMLVTVYTVKPVHFSVFPTIFARCNFIPIVSEYCNNRDDSTMVEMEHSKQVVLSKPLDAWLSETMLLLGLLFLLFL